MNKDQARVTMVNGPVVKADGMRDFAMREMVMVGRRKLIGEIIGLSGSFGTIQVYEETEGLEVGEPIIPTDRPLSVKLGPGLMGNIFDGIERPLTQINSFSPGFIAEGIGLISIDKEETWRISFSVEPGDDVRGGQIFGEVQETSLIMHRVMVPPGMDGTVEWVKPEGRYTIDEPVMGLRLRTGGTAQLSMAQDWPVRKARPVRERLILSKPLVTGQRVLDIFFPLAKGALQPSPAASAPARP